MTPQPARPRDTRRPAVRCSARSSRTGEQCRAFRGARRRGCGRAWRPGAAGPGRHGAPARPGRPWRRPRGSVGAWTWTRWTRCWSGRPPRTSRCCASRRPARAHRGRWWGIAGPDHLGDGRPHVLVAMNGRNTTPRPVLEALPLRRRGEASREGGGAGCAAPRTGTRCRFGRRRRAAQRAGSDGVSARRLVVIFEH